MSDGPHKIKIYFDTSVLSYLKQDDAPERKKITCEVWETLKSGKYDILISSGY